MTYLYLECSDSGDGANIGEYIRDFLETPSALQDLTLEFCNHLVLGENHFTNLTSLRFLAIQNGSPVQEIDGDAFQNLHNLQLLKMIHLDLPSFPEALLKTGSKSDGNITKSSRDMARFPNLSQLYLSHNNIHTIPFNAFSNMPSLELLDLSTNQLMELKQESFHQLGNLRTLNISENIFTKIPQGFWKSFLSLQILVLSHSLISSYDNQTFDSLPQLVRLEVNSGKLAHIQGDAFHGIPSAEEIIITTEFMKSIPAELFQGMNSLRKIQLTGGFYPISLPLDKMFLNLPNLESITAQRNNIITLSDMNLLGSRRIRLFDLADNVISAIPVGFFSQEMSQVEYIELQKNNLSIIATETFSNLLNIQGINLSQNKLVYLASEAFDNLPLLHNLSLSQNYLSRIRSDTFFRVEQMHFLDLSGNLLTNFQTLQLNHIAFDGSNDAMAVNVDMSQNPLSCDCEMFELLAVTGDNFKELEIKSWPHSQSLANQHFKSYEKLVCRIPGNIVTWYDEYYYCSWGLDQLCSKVSTVVASQYGEDFFCESTFYCPSYCECYQQAASLANIMLCIGHNLTHVPVDLPNDTNVLNLQANNISELHPGDFSRMSNLRSLSLESNHIHYIPKGVFNELSKLENLYLHDNSITELQMGCFSNLTKLKMLTLHGNALRTIAKGIFDGMTSLTSISLQNNPLQCNCSLLWLKTWMQEMAKDGLIDVDTVNCTTSMNVTGAIVFFENNDFMCTIPIMTIIAVCLGTLLTISLLIITTIYFKTEVQVLLYSYFNIRFTLKKQDEDDNKIYDTFISYSSDDYQYVIFELLTKLEEHQPPYKVCIHQRDFLVGEAIANNIVNAIESSKRTIVILSENYLDSEWCLYEFKVAHSQFLREHKNRIIIVRMEDVDNDKMDRDMRVFVSMNTYLERQDPLFMKRLLYALPKPREAPPIGPNDPGARNIVEMDDIEEPVYDDDDVNLIN